MSERSETRSDVRPSGVDGWLTAEQASVLADAAAGCRPGTQIVEIGSFQGLSTIVLATHATEGVDVVAIDPHGGNDRGPGEINGYAEAAAADHAAFERNLESAGVRHRVRHVRAPSNRAHEDVRGDIEVVYVDGAHRYRPARADIRDWGARVADGGTLLVHDAFSSVGVTLAVMRELVLGRRFRYLGRSRSLARYRADLGSQDLGGRVANAAAQLAELAWFARNVAIKVFLASGGGTVLRRLGRRVPEWPY